ncbi:MAG: hypothetical protein M1385_01715 [Candidatus Marsarchaeota archaeon]|nr:hypothetical protein [Candidatus Marsarchaeota archaeon]
MQNNGSKFITAANNIIGKERSEALVEFIRVKLPYTDFFKPKHPSSLINCKMFNGSTWDNALDRAMRFFKDGSHTIHYPTINILNRHDKERIDRYYPFIRNEIEEQIVGATNSKVITYYQLVGAISAANDIASYLLLRDVMSNPCEFADFALNHWKIYENGFCTIGQLKPIGEENKKSYFYVYFSNRNPQ